MTELEKFVKTKAEKFAISQIGVDPFEKSSKNLFACIEFSVMFQWKHYKNQKEKEKEFFLDCKISKTDIAEIKRMVGESELLKMLLIYKNNELTYRNVLNFWKDKNVFNIKNYNDDEVLIYKEIIKLI